MIRHVAVVPPMMAEYGWDLAEATIKKARRELNEVPERRQVALEAVREQMVTRPDVSKYKTRDPFLIPCSQGPNSIYTNRQRF